ncbi:2-oxoacid:acceptor oxidoreductase family protein [Cuniculiplasma sp. SKW3]|uniref:2-oxoacid:acceptor oxidoreductase family protein n=1 Tax=Cuniculiplasma sp. SKW3 TaxID=3400170 RepID=UPI003FCFF37B
MTSYRILGRGGQGVITLGKVLTQAIIYSGENGIMSEIHGLSQRGGGVVTDVKSGNSYSPLIMSGTADYILSMDLDEAFSNKGSLKSEGICISVSYEEYDHEEEKIDGLECIKINPSRIAPDMDRRSHNMFLLGVFSAIDPFPKPENIMRAISEVFSEKIAPGNMDSFNKGRDYYRSILAGTSAESD